MLPQIEFVYNKEYDDVYRDLWYLYDTTGARYPSDEIDIQEYINDHIKPMREKYGETILKKIEQIGVYKWTERYIPIYIIGSAKSLWGGLANPTTIAIRKNPNLMIDIIMHELIHYYQYLSGKNRNEYISYAMDLYKINDINIADHILLYAMQDKIYSNIPSQEIYKLENLSKLYGKYQTYIDKTREIGINIIINDYSNFIEKKPQVIIKKKYPNLQYRNFGSYSKVFASIYEKGSNNEKIDVKKFKDDVTEFNTNNIKKNRNLLIRIPQIIGEVTSIEWKVNEIAINMVGTNKYNINMPMTISIYDTKNNIIDISIEKVIKYFIYFHKKEIKKYCKKENIEENKLFDYLFENVKKELAN